MKGIRIALAQLNPTVGDLEGNRRLCEEAAAAAGAAGAGLTAFPELVLTGYPPEDLVLKPSFVKEGVRALERLAGSLKGMAAIVGFVEPDGGAIYNSAALLVGGEVAAVYRKHVLPNYGVFDERRYFKPGEGLVLAAAGGLRVGIIVCEDLWDPQGPHNACAAAGAQVLISINASPYHRGKRDERMDLIAGRARATGAAVAYVNQVGGQDELVFDGLSTVAGPTGEVLARAAQFEEELLVTDIASDLFGPSPSRGSGPAPAEPVRLVEVDAPEAPGPPAPVRVAPLMEDLAEVYSALVTGTRDYLVKNGFDSAVLGLSGGIDSALTAAIAADAIGAQAVLGVMLPSEHTSGESTLYATQVAERLGIELATIPIKLAYQALVDALEPVFATSTPGVAEENLQSRIRGTLLMAISNKTGRILLSTGNKSELATGYATLYGDMAGGFAVLKDVPKSLVYALARWRNTSSEVIPEPVLTRPPTAELRPGQLDTDALPPYDLLDGILERYIENNATLGEIVAAGYDREVAAAVVAMVDRAEYKRRQAPPGVKITRLAFGRDRRLPITNRYRDLPGG